jgi:hypothetical protein
MSSDAPHSVPEAPTITHLYRFRPLTRLLGGELLNQQIYFAKPETLNDPMEGFRDIYWRGDAIVWRNLFRHFALCVERAVSLLTIIGESAPLGWDMIPVFNHGDISFTPQQKAHQDDVLATLFKDELIQNWIAALAARAQPVRRAELAAHLRSIHPLVVATVQACYRKRGMITAPEPSPTLLETLRENVVNSRTAIDSIRKMEEEGNATEFQIDAFYTAHLKMLAEMDLIHLYNEAIDPKMTNRNFVFLTFCDEFVDRIETLAYPEWYTACFMEECRDSSVWGSYGQNHTAACLKFRVKDLDGNPALPIHRPTGANNAGLICAYRDHAFRRIVYENEHLPVDFFNSLGRLPMPVLRRYWYSDPDGGLSSCGDQIFKEADAWRTQYWDAFYHAITRKLKDWRYEREHRLILSGEFFDFGTDESRVLKYDFNSLDGIIFGIKTPNDAKLEIFKIIEDLCRANSRKDFKFYQAFYSRASGMIEHAELTFLKFKF